MTRGSNACEPRADDLMIAGPIDVTVHVATTCSEADFIVKVIDGFPNDSPPQHASGPRMDAYEQLVHGNVFRARWRRSFEKPEPLIPGRLSSLALARGRDAHVESHRMMVQVQAPGSARRP